MQYWLMKSEPTTYGIDHLAKDKVTAWTGVRNYQARNYMRDAMHIGDGVLFYHSSCAEPGIAGLAEVASTARPDPTQFDRKSDYYDPKSNRTTPRWLMVEVRALRKTRLVTIAELKAHKALARMWTLRPGNRLSITPVSKTEWQHITGKLI